MAKWNDQSTQDLDDRVTQAESQVYLLQRKVNRLVAKILELNPGLSVYSFEETALEDTPVIVPIAEPVIDVSDASTAALAAVAPVEEGTPQSEDPQKPWYRKLGI